MLYISTYYEQKLKNIDDLSEIIITTECHPSDKKLLTQNSSYFSRT